MRNDGNSNLISPSAKNANSSNNIFKGETRMNRCKESATKSWQAPCRHPITWKAKNSKNSINFFSHSQLRYKLCGLINDDCYVTYPSARRSHCSHRQSWWTNLCYSRAYDGSGFWASIQLGLNLLQMILIKCYSDSNFSSISVFHKSASFNSDLI